MTERLRDGMRSELKSKGHPWGKTLVVLPGTESRSDGAVVIPDGRTDIPLMLIEVFLRTQEHDPHAIIECKRIIGSDTHLCREYVVEGVDRFRTGKYGQNHAFGFMVGYPLAPALFRHPSVFQSFYENDDWVYEQRDGQLLFRSVQTVVAGQLRPELS